MDTALIIFIQLLCVTHLGWSAIRLDKPKEVSIDNGIIGETYNVRSSSACAVKTAFKYIVCLNSREP